MRREQTLKVCANHLIIASITIEKMKGNTCYIFGMLALVRIFQQDFLQLCIIHSVLHIILKYIFITFVVAFAILERFGKALSSMATV